MTWQQTQRKKLEGVAPMAFKMEKGATSHGMQAASKS